MNDRFFSGTFFTSNSIKKYIYILQGTYQKINLQPK